MENARCIPNIRISGNPVSLLNVCTASLDAAVCTDTRERGGAPPGRGVACRTDVYCMHSACHTHGGWLVGLGAPAEG